VAGGGLSLRSRLLAGVAAVVVVLVAVAIAVTTLIRDHLVDQIDDSLVAATASRRADGPGPRPRVAKYYEGIWQAGTYLVVVQAYGGTQPDVGLEQALRAAASHSPFTVGSADGASTRWRVLARSTNDGVYIVAAPLDDVDDVVRRLIAIEAIATGGIVVVLGAVAWWVIRLGIRPVKQMTATAAKIAAGDLSQRVPDASPTTEAGQLGLALNHMMEQLEGAFHDREASQQRLQQFVADASHELRTPVTTIRGYAELYRLGGLTGDERLGEAMRRTEQEAVRMSRLVDDMLTIAKLGAGRPLDQRPVDLARLVADAAADARAVAPDRVITVTAPASLPITGDEDRLRQVLANVVGNALVHTPAGTPIELDAGATTGPGGAPAATITVADHGPGMTPEDAAKVTERFYRADPGRSRDRGGSGLGMAIVEATVGAHGGSVRVDSALGAGTKVTVMLPRDIPPVPPPAR